MSHSPSNIPVVYINLDSATERRRRLESEFLTHQISAERIDAVRWTSLSVEAQAKYYSSDLNEVQYHSPLVNGEKGCYASHIQAWRLLLSSKAEWMVVLEDDVRLKPGFDLVVQSVSELKIPWDMVKLIGRTEEKVRNKKFLGKDFQLIDYSRVPSYTAGYLVSRRGAEKMLASRIPFGRPIDVDLRFWWENDLIIYGVWPPVLALDETSDDSTIPGRKSSPTWVAKWRKFKMKTWLTVGNAIYSARRKKTIT